MDNTKQYVKQCEKAYPYLRGCIPLFSKRRRMYYVVDGEVGLWWDIVNTSNCQRAFPLWEQAQLQKMVNDNINSVIKQVGIVNCLHFKNLTEMLAMSWEQLWLALVMKEKYGKVWNGEDWINEG